MHWSIRRMKDYLTQNMCDTWSVLHQIASVEERPIAGIEETGLSFYTTYNYILCHPWYASASSIVVCRWPPFFHLSPANTILFFPFFLCKFASQLLSRADQLRSCGIFGDDCCWSCLLCIFWPALLWLSIVVDPLVATVRRTHVSIAAIWSQYIKNPNIDE